MKEPRVPINVVFRKFDDGDVIALFPEETTDPHGNIMSYMHIGQHSAAHPSNIFTLSRCDYNEYQDLLDELTNHVEYDVTVWGNYEVRQWAKDNLDISHFDDDMRSTLFGFLGGVDDSIKLERISDYWIWYSEGLNFPYWVSNLDGEELDTFSTRIDAKNFIKSLTK